MQTTLELLKKAPESLLATGVRSAFVPRNRAVIAADRGCGSVTTVLEPAREPAMDGFCLWCDRTFSPRQQADRLRGSAARDTGSSSGSRRVAVRCGRSRRAYSRSIASRRLTRACTLPEGH